MAPEEPSANRLAAPVPPASSPGVARSMRGNRRRDTSPEMRLRSALHARGWRFRVDLAVAASGGRARPDIAFTRTRVAVFVDGCFWHCCPEHGRPPLSNTAYWGPKLARNVERDRIDSERLEAAGWRVLRLWEHVPLEEAVAVVERELNKGVAYRSGASRSAPGLAVGLECSRSPTISRPH